MVVQKKILVVGSGGDLEVDVASFDLVYAANSSFTRLRNAQCLSLVLSDAMLFSLDDLNNHHPIPGMERSASNELRMGKYKTLDGHNFEKINVIDSGNVDIDVALKRKRMSVNSLSRIDFKGAWKLLNGSFNVLDLISIFLAVRGLTNKLRFLLQWLTNKKMNVGFRPSTGIYSLMLAFHENPKADVFVNGINVVNNHGERVSKYSSVALPFQKNVHLLDSLYFELLLDKGLRIHKASK